MTGTTTEDLNAALKTLIVEECDKDVPPVRGASP
jgi:hypothetical protein